MAGNSATLELPRDLPDLPTDWIYRPLGELVTKPGICYGIVQPGKDTSDGVPIVRVNNIRDGRIDTSDVKRVLPEIAESFGRSQLKGGEVLLTLVGTLGEVAIVPEELAGWNVARAVGVIPVNGEVDNQWVSLCLRSGLIQHYIRMWATTTVQATFNLRDVARLPIPVPPKAERDTIAEILGGLDAKIELNRRMNETLESLARALFKSWFVDFDPVRAKLDGRQPPNLPPPTAALFPDSFEHGPDGALIPAGWRIGTVDDLCAKIENGGTPKRRESGYWLDGTVPWFKTGELLDSPLIRAEEHITQLGLAESSCKLWQPGTVLMALYASPTVGRLGILEIEGTSNQAASALVARDGIGPQFLFYTLFNARDDLQQIAVGAAQQNINQQVVRNHKVLVPSDKAATAFGDSVTPLYRKRVENARESETLAALRDTLLPRLLSGELRVADAKQAVAMQDAETNE